MASPVVAPSLALAASRWALLGARGPEGLPEESAAGKVNYNFRDIEPFSDELHAISAFCKDKKGDVYHTYSTYARGVDMLNTAYNYLDLTAKGQSLPMRMKGRGEPCHGNMRFCRSLWRPGASSSP